MKRKGVLTGAGRAGLRQINEELEEASRGIDNGKVRGGAAISTRKLNTVDCGEVTVGTSETIVRHNLGVTPHYVTITMRTTGMIWESSRADTAVVRLTADSSGRKAHVLVHG